MSESVTREQVLEALEGIIDPDLGKSVVQAGFVKNLTIQGGRVSFDLELTTPACPLKSQFQKKAQELVGGLPGVESVEVRLTSRVRQAQPMSQKPLLPGVKLMVAVASGKGGVGKSTVAANLAVALARTGAATGLVDVDVYGPSAQIMFGIPQGSRPEVNADQKLVPLVAHGVKIMSMAFLARDDTPVLWRGPLVAKLVQDFLAHVEWGELDYLVVDLPPGTGDAQLTLCQSAPLTGAVIVTTPQDVSLVDARKGLELFRKVNVPVLGIVENMSYFLCPHCGKRTEIFRHGGGAKVARQLGVAFLGEIPLEAEVAVSGDEGIPIVAKNPDSPVSRAYRALAGEVARQLSILSQGKEGEASLELDWEKAPAVGEKKPRKTEAKEGEKPRLLGIYKVDERTLGLSWSDGWESAVPVRLLRLGCPCAECVDEISGKRTLDPARVPEDVKPVRIEPVGAYALKFVWSDGHDSGIYSFDTLRELDPMLRD